MTNEHAYISARLALDLILNGVASTTPVADVVLPAPLRSPALDGWTFAPSARTLLDVLDALPGAVDCLLFPAAWYGVMLPCELTSPHCAERLVLNGALNDVALPRVPLGRHVRADVQVSIRRAVLAMIDSAAVGALLDLDGTLYQRRVGGWELAEC